MTANDRITAGSVDGRVEENSTPLPEKVTAHGPTTHAAQGSPLCAPPIRAHLRTAREAGVRLADAIVWYLRKHRRAVLLPELECALLPQAQGGGSAGLCFEKGLESPILWTGPAGLVNALSDLLNARRIYLHPSTLPDLSSFHVEPQGSRFSRPWYPFHLRLVPYFDRPLSSFGQWLRQQADRDDEVGDLARDYEADLEAVQRPSCATVPGLRRRLVAKGACLAALNALELAAREYRLARRFERRRP